MSRFLSVTALLQGITGAMALVLVITFALSAERAYEKRGASEQVLAVASAPPDAGAAAEVCAGPPYPPA